MRKKTNEFAAGSTKLFGTMLAVAAAVVISICIFFVFNIHETTAKETERYLTELSASVVYSVDARLEANLDALESLAVTYVEMKKLNLIDIDYIQKKALTNKFQTVYIMNLDGEARGTNGALLYFANKPEIMEALGGKRVVFNDALIYGQTRSGFAYAVPIYENGVITGALVAGNTTEWIKNLLEQTYFEGDGFFHVIDSDGAFVIKSTNASAMSENQNIFRGLEEGAQFGQGTSLEQLKKLVADNHRGTVYFTMYEDGIPKIGKIIPTGHEGFYLFLVVLERAASHQFDTLLSRAIWNNIWISIMFLGLFIVLFVTNRKNNRHLSTLAFVDPVTQGFSRLRFELESKKLIQAAAPKTFVLVSLNVVRFKWVNDAFGTANGDKVLKHIHDVLLGHLSKQELLCRSSSDNFDLLLKSRPDEDISRFVKEIALEVNAFNDELMKKYYLPLTAGVYQIDDVDLPLVHIRDRANVARKNVPSDSGSLLYSCGFYSDLERQRQLREKEMENKMRAALEHREFKVYLQPKFSLENNKVAGAEALVRWLDVDWGLVPPNSFIPFFEKNGFIVQVDLYVFAEACRTIRSWLDAGVEAVPISVNLSRAHLYNDHFLQDFIDIQQQYDIPPALLEIELTETLLFENLERVSKVIDEIHEAGYQCSMDDFGSGYSSLNLLKDVKVDTLKLDGAFFRSPIEDNPRGRAIIASMVDMAKKLSMKTVCEGVETTYQLDFLREIHCDLVQGYIFSKPTEINAFESMAFGREITDKTAVD